MSIDSVVANLAAQLSHRAAVSMNAILAGMAPSQKELFTLPAPGIWVYKVEYRVWLRYADGRECWSPDWYHAVNGRTCLAWYKRRADAEKALVRHRARHSCWGVKEYRVRAETHPEYPYRRDLDPRAKNINRLRSIK